MEVTVGNDRANGGDTGMKAAAGTYLTGGGDTTGYVNNSYAGYFSVIKTQFVLFPIL